MLTMHKLVEQYDTNTTKNLEIDIEIVQQVENAQRIRFHLAVG